MDSIVQYLERSARQFGDQLAIRSARESVTYATLWQHVNAVAAQLRRLGLQPGDRVALALNNSVAYVAVFYGVLAAGGITVALNAAAKARDFSRWLAHSGARWLYAESDDREIAQACGELKQLPQRMLFDPSLADGSRAWSAGRVTESTPALMLYTSGTTGNPKGVLLSHGNLASNTQAIIDFLRLGSGDSSVVVLPFFYSYGNSVLHTHLAAGATLIIEPNLVYPHKMVETLATSRASGFAGVPSTYALLLSRVKLREYDLSSLRYLTQAGGPMPVTLINRLRAALPGVAVYVMYGQTEATARISWLPPERLESKPGSVGIAVSGVEIAVHREDGSRTAPGESGEVWVRGPNVMLGYWHNEAATAEVRRGDWLRTGDLGHLDSDGYLYLAGRRSDMIKTGAHRVNPLDVEEVIAEMPDVAEVAVVPAMDELLGETIRAVVVLQAGAARDEMHIKAWCRERLAGYMVPKFVDFSAGLPRTASGKIRRQELVSGRKA